MANTDNTCSQLEIKDYWSDRAEPSEDTLGDILNLQAETQKDVYGYDFKNMALREVMDFWHMNNHAMIDEIMRQLMRSVELKMVQAMPFGKDGKRTIVHLDQRNSLICQKQTN